MDSKTFPIMLEHFVLQMSYYHFLEIIFTFGRIHLRRKSGTKGFIYLLGNTMTC